MVFHGLLGLVVLFRVDCLQWITPQVLPICICVNAVQVYSTLSRISSGVIQERVMVCALHLGAQVLVRVELHVLGIVFVVGVSAR